jgi:ankyrin repeat protein
MRAILLIHLLVTSIQFAQGDDLTPDQRLIIACYKRDVEGVVSCLRAGANVNGTFGETDERHFQDAWTGGLPIGITSWTPLLALANSPDYPDPPEGFNIERKSPDEIRALQRQWPQEQLDKRRGDARTILFILLASKCDLDNHDGYGTTALFKAVETGKVSMVKTLLQFGASPNTKTQAYIDGPSDITPLHEACNSRELMQLLLDHGADASAKDSDGHTPADWLDLNSNRDFDLVVTPDGPRLRPRQRQSR